MVDDAAVSCAWAVPSALGADDSLVRLMPLAVHTMAMLCGDTMGAATATPTDSTNHANT